MMGALITILSVIVILILGYLFFVRGDREDKKWRVESDTPDWRKKIDGRAETEKIVEPSEEDKADNND